MIAAAKKLGKAVDGHAPGLRGKTAARYAAAGITTDHECFTLPEALDKLKARMRILIREGSAARNFAALEPLLKSHPAQAMFCCDDLHPDLLMVRHLDEHVRRALRGGRRRQRGGRRRCLCRARGPPLRQGRPACVPAERGRRQQEVDQRQAAKPPHGRRAPPQGFAGLAQRGRITHGGDHGLAHLGVQPGLAHQPGQDAGQHPHRRQQAGQHARGPAAPAQAPQQPAGRAQHQREHTRLAPQPAVDQPVQRQQRGGPVPSRAGHAGPTWLIFPWRTRTVVPAGRNRLPNCNACASEPALPLQIQPRAARASATASHSSSTHTTSKTGRRIRR